MQFSCLFPKPHAANLWASSEVINPRNYRKLQATLCQCPSLVHTLWYPFWASKLTRCVVPHWGKSPTGYRRRVTAGTQSEVQKPGQVWRGFSAADAPGGTVNPAAELLLLPYARTSIFILRQGGPALKLRLLQARRMLAKPRILAYDVPIGLQQNGLLSRAACSTTRNG